MRSFLTLLLCQFVTLVSATNLVWYDGQPEKLKEEVGGDADNIKRIFGYAPVGMSWPGSELNASETTIKKIIELTDIRYSRCAAHHTHDFSLPKQ